MRAMREAKYRERSAAPTGVSAPARRPTLPESAGVADTSAPEPTTDALCGHRSMNGRTCTREQGHAAKSHRYS